jgi:hypothetical protein
VAGERPDRLRGVLLRFDAPSPCPDLPARPIPRVEIS